MSKENTNIKEIWNRFVQNLKLNLLLLFVLLCRLNRSVTFFFISLNWVSAQLIKQHLGFNSNYFELIKYFIYVRKMINFITNRLSRDSWIIAVYSGRLALLKMRKATANLMSTTSCTNSVGVWKALVFSYLFKERLRKWKIHCKMST